uniref:Uncharacterized protein n=1 Tax=Glossina morsitans morsitans TaxID=37546 RepID=A0A1B0GD76_GLOMM
MIVQLFIRKKFSDIADLITSKYHDMNEKGGILNIQVNYNTVQTHIKSTIDPIYFDKKQSIGSLLGFSKRKLQQGIEHYSDKTIDITKINTVMIECNIVSGSYINNVSAHTLHQFTLTVGPTYKIVEIPTNVIYLSINTRTINSIVLKVVDQSGNLINFRGEKISIRLHLKPSSHK